MVYLQRCFVVTWLVPREAAAVSEHVLCSGFVVGVTFTDVQFGAAVADVAQKRGDWDSPSTGGGDGGVSIGME